MHDPGRRECRARLSGHTAAGRGGLFGGAERTMPSSIPMSRALGWQSGSIPGRKTAGMAARTRGCTASRQLGSGGRHSKQWQHFHQLWHPNELRIRQNRADYGRRRESSGRVLQVGIDQFYNASPLAIVDVRVGGQPSFPEVGCITPNIAVIWARGRTPISGGWDLPRPPLRSPSMSTIVPGGLNGIQYRVDAVTQVLRQRQLGGGARWELDRAGIGVQLLDGAGAVLPLGWTSQSTAITGCLAGSSRFR